MIFRLEWFVLLAVVSAEVNHLLVVVVEMLLPLKSMVMEPSLVSLIIRDIGEREPIEC
jgi:hypothetical protein